MLLKITYIVILLSAFLTLPSVEGQVDECPEAFSYRSDVFNIYNLLYCSGLSSCANVTVNTASSWKFAVAKQQYVVNKWICGTHIHLEVRSYMGLFKAKLVENSQDNPDTILIACDGEAACMFTHSMQASEVYCEGLMDVRISTLH